MNKLTNCIIKKDSSCVPIWFMRQAGRYLPEFKKIRSQNKDFIKLCLNSQLSSLITLQPINRFNLDAAIIFSDILMVPHALGQDVIFTKEYGPKLSDFNIKKFLNCNEEDFVFKLNPVYDSISKTRKNLNKDKSIISFVGSPWTLIIYMLGLKNNENNLKLDLLNIKYKEIDILIEKLTKFLCLHIKKQIEAGADTVQLFDTWAGLIQNEDLERFCYEPNLKIVEYCKTNKIPVICFPKGLGKNYLNFLKIVKPDCINIDYNVDPLWAKENFKDVCIQGGMDPKILLLEENEIYQEAKKYLKIFKDYPYIFNLGHGILPETKPEIIDKLVKYVKEYK
tara:strand:+ start:481 stop:1491 length:1011 start_codon:yes stop_codon:yes gene_type:complete